MRLFFLTTTIGLLGACATPGVPVYTPVPQETQQQIQKPQIRDDYYSDPIGQNSLRGTTWGVRAFYAYMAKPSVSPWKVRESIAAGCRYYRFPIQSQECYLYARDQFLKGGYESFGQGVEFLGYAFGWTKKKTEPIRDRFGYGIWRGENNE